MIMRDYVTAKERTTFEDRTVYGLHCDSSVLFMSLEEAEDYLVKNYEEYCSHKDSAMDFCEQMIWEDKISNVKMKEVK